MPTPTVREVEPTDFEPLLAMARAMHAESPEHRELTFSADKALDTMVSVFQGARQFVNGWVLELDGEIIGALFGALSDTFYSDDLIATDLVVYIKPEHRGRPAGAIKLLRVYEEWARARGAKIILLGITTGIAVERTQQLYERLGYRAVGPILKKN